MSLSVDILDKLKTVLNNLIAGTFFIGKVACDSGKSSCTMVRPNNATAYDINDVVGTDTPNNFVFLNVLATPGQRFIITSVTLEIDVNAVPSGMGGFKLWLYDTNPAIIADHAAYNLPAADRGKCLGHIPIATPIDAGDTLWSQNDNVNFNGKLADGSTSLYGIMPTDNAFTPSAVTIKKVTLYSVGV